MAFSIALLSDRILASLPFRVFQQNRPKPANRELEKETFDDSHQRPGDGGAKRCRWTTTARGKSSRLRALDEKHFTRLNLLQYSFDLLRVVDEASPMQFA